MGETLGMFVVLGIHYLFSVLCKLLCSFHLISPSNRWNFACISDEPPSKLKHDQPGLLSMALADRDARGSLFIITFKANHHLDR